jgi:hypothetical protein
MAPECRDVQIHADYGARFGDECTLDILESGAQKLMSAPSVQPPSGLGVILSDNPSIDLLVPHQVWNERKGKPPSHSFAKEIAPEAGGSSFSRSSHLMKSLKVVFLFPWRRDAPGVLSLSAVACQQGQLPFYPVGYSLACLSHLRAIFH